MLITGASAAVLDATVSVTAPPVLFVQRERKRKLWQVTGDHRCFEYSVKLITIMINTL